MGQSEGNASGEGTPDLDPYEGMSEDEGMRANGYDPDFIDALDQAFGFTGESDQPRPSTDDWENDFTDGSTSAEVHERVKSGMKIWSDDATPEEIAAGTFAEEK